MKKKMKFRKVLVASLLTILFLNSAVNISFSNSGINVVDVVSEYVPIKWALIVLGGFNYYTDTSQSNAIQKAEHWIQSEGVPYDVIEDDNIDAPTDTPTLGNYSLQYANGTIKYGVFVIIMNNHADTTSANVNYIYWAVGNGTEAVIFGMAAKYVPSLLNISSTDVKLDVDWTITKIDCSVKKTFSDGIIEYEQGTKQEIDFNFNYNVNVSNTEGKTVWYTVHTDTGKNYVGMMNTTYGSGKVFWNGNMPSYDRFFFQGGLYWETKNLKFIGHAINFMFKQVSRIDLGLQGYKRWGGAVTYRLDQDTFVGIERQNETAMEKGWYYDVVICPLGYLTNGGDLTSGMPSEYVGAPSSKVKCGTFLIEHWLPRTFIVYNSTVGGDYDRVKVDWNQNQNFTDDTAYGIWENMTSAETGMLGTYYWCFISNWTEPTSCGFSWWCPLRERISDFSWYKEMGENGYVRYGFHSWQHIVAGISGDSSVYHMWNGTHFVINQTWIEQKFTDARNELAYCLGSTGYGFEADEGLVSHAGNTYLPETQQALNNLDWVYLDYSDNEKKAAGWFLYSNEKPALGCGTGEIRLSNDEVLNSIKDAVQTLYPFFGVFAHNAGHFDLTWDIYPSHTAFTDMFCFAHLDESFEFWFNSRYMLTNTANAYYYNNKIILEYKANNTLTDYVWKFPLMYNGKYFNGFSDSRTAGKIKHIDGKYVYIEFSEGGNERLEATYGTNPHICTTSSYIQNINQIYTSKHLTLQLLNTSGTINVEVNCTKLEQPNSVKTDGTSINFNYNPATKICSFNIAFTSLKTVEIVWEHTPPNPPTLVSPAPTSRFDPSKSLTFTWEFSDPDQDDSQSAYRFQLSDNYDFTSPIIDTGKVASPSIQTIQTLPNTLALYYWRVKSWDNRDAEGEWSATRLIIVDRLNIILKGVTANRVDVGASVFIYFKAIREYDDSLFDGTKGTVYINGSAATWDEENKYWKLGVTQNSVGLREYEVSSITDTEHHITAINDIVGMQQVIWDKLIVTITSDPTTTTVGGQVDFSVTAIYDYDNERVPKFTVNVLRDEAHFATNNFTDIYNIESIHQYTTENITENTYGLTAFSSNSSTIAWAPKPLTQLLVDWITSNALILAAIIQIVIVLAFLLIRERRKHTNT
jgi:hypothetical protein